MKYHTCIIPNCPRCNSNITGRYLENITGQSVKNEIEYLKKGEYVKISYYNNGQNLFCLDCGFEWNGKIEKKWLTKKELDILKETLEITPEDISGYDKFIVEETINKKKKHKHHTVAKKGLFFLTGKVVNSILSPVMELKELEKAFEPSNQNKEQKK